MADQTRPPKLRLIDGRIPPHTECPYRARCQIAADGECKHRGAAHPVPFSCASARGFEIVDRRAEADHVYYFGCWNRAGHYLHAPGGDSVRDEAPIYYGATEHIYIDGTLAPRQRRDGEICWVGQGKTRYERDYLRHYTSEYLQGQFLRHVLDNGFTALQWWDRTQGDDRAACNSTILVEGEHSTEEMLTALRRHFPHVLDNLARAGVALVEVPAAKR